MARILTILVVGAFALAGPERARADFTQTGSSGDMSFLMLLDTFYNNGNSTFVGDAYGGAVYTSGIGIEVRRVDDFGSPGGALNILNGYGNTAGAGTSSGLDRTWDDGVADIFAQAKFVRNGATFGYTDGAGYNELFVVTEDGFVDGAMLIVDLTDKEWTWNSRYGPNTFSSEQTLNADGLDHMIAYEVTGLGSATTWLLFWELDGGIGGDFNDLVVQVDAVAHVPAPGAVLLGAIGIGFVGWMKRRRGAA